MSEFRVGSKLTVIGWMPPRTLKSSRYADCTIVDLISRDLMSRGIDVEYRYLGERGLLCAWFALFWLLKSHREKAQTGKIQTGNLVLTGILSERFIEAVSLVDLGFKAFVREVSEDSDYILLLGPVATISSIKRAIARPARVGLLETNLSQVYLATLSATRSTTWFRRFVSRLTELAEHRAISDADFVFTVSRRDTIRLSKSFPGKDIEFYLPIRTLDIDDEAAFPKSTRRIRDVLSGQVHDISPHDFNVLFLGSNSKVNQEGLTRLVSIARRIEEPSRFRVRFIVVGEVFKTVAQTDLMPSSILFTGFQPELDPILEYAGIFVVFDLLGTGIEIKALSYAKIPRPILVISNSSPEEYRGLFGSRVIWASDEKQAADLIVGLARSSSSAPVSTIAGE